MSRPPLRLTARLLRKAEDFAESPVPALRAIAAIRQRLDEIEPEAIEQARANGCTWEDLAEALGVTRQAIHQRHRNRLRTGGSPRGRQAADGR